MIRWIKSLGISNGTIYKIIDSSLGLNDFNKNGLSFYPNPAKTELNLNVSQNDINELSISNLLGQVLIKSQNQLILF